MTKSTLIAKSLRCAALLASTAISTAALANDLPTGGEVAAGSVTIGAPSAGTMAITQHSDRAVVNWTSFSVGEGNAVNIAQPNANSALLNRVTGDATSVIAGQINANGQVFLVNLNGIAITKSGTVNAAAFTASTLDIADRDFMAGGDVLTVTARANAHVMRLRAGLSDLMSPDLADGTLLVAGVAKMEGSDQAALDLTGDGFLRLGLPTGSIDVAGTINANTVVLTAGTARDAARGVVNLSGVINATGVDTKGGVVRLTGDVINLTGATIDASGALGGGSIAIGGGYQGTGNQAHATDLTVDAGSTIRADALRSGDGGEVVLWSDHKTAFAGTITARGGANGGDGGNAEVSGKALLAYEGFTNLLAPKGKTGNLLLDPYNVTISSAANSNQSSFTATGDDSVINVTTLTNALANANVTVTTGSGGSQAGTILVNTDITWNAATTLELSAAGNIVLNAEIVNSANDAGLILRADNAGSGTGTIIDNYGVVDTINLSGAGSTVDIYYNPTDYTNPTNVTDIMIAETVNAWMLVNTLQNLQDMKTNLSGNYALSKNIDASDTAGWYIGLGFAPIGGNGPAFTGKFDGQGHIISNLMINRPSEYFAGLFGNANGATISNVGMEGGSISGNNYVGGLVGFGYAVTISNAYATGAVSGQAEVGGLVGSAENGTLSNSYATGAVSGQADVGGLIGKAYDATLTNSYATGAVSGQAEVGGLIGKAYYGTLSNSYWDEYSTGQNNAIGAIGGTTVTGVLAVTSDPSQSGAGNYAFKQSAYAGFDFTNDWFISDDSTRPFGRWEYTTEITNSHQLQLIAMDLAADYKLGADIDLSETGWARADNPASYAGMWSSEGFSPLGAVSGFFTGSLDGQNNVISGLFVDRLNSTNPNYIALFGVLDGASITNLGLNEVSLSGRSVVGALAGYATGLTTIENSYATGSVSGEEFVGGLLGATTGTTTITNVYADVGASATGKGAGGLVGTAAQTTITKAYATGAVTGSASVGGLVGSASATTIDKVYATGKVTGTSNVGGLIGLATNGGTLSNSYWDEYSTGQAERIGTNDSGNPATIDKVLRVNSAPSQSGETYYAFNQSAYTNFDLDNDWFMIDGSTRPFGRWEYSTEIANSHQLQLMAMDLAASYTLGADIDLSATGAVTEGDAASYAGMWSSAGWSSVGAGSGPFTGKFNGQGHVISGLTINRPAVENIGLFGLANGGAITDIGLENVSIVGRTTVGGLVGLASDLEINNVYVTGTVSGGGYAGGLVGQSLGSTQISHSYASATVAAGGAVGGLVGLMQNTSSVSNSYATGDVSGDEAIGGLVGAGSGTFTISNSYAAGKVSGNTSVGGIIGGGAQGTVTNSYWDSYGTGQSSGIGGEDPGNPVTLTSLTELTSDPTKSDAVNYALKASAWSNFQTAGASDIDTVGGQDKVWRMYDGYTMPLLKAFMTRLDVTASGSKTITYNGQEQSLTPTVAMAGYADQSLVLGSVGGIKGTDAGTYSDFDFGLYSVQQGYDLVVSGSASLTINRAQLTVTYTAKAGSRAYGAANGTLSGSYETSGLVGQDKLADIVSGTASWASTADQTTGVGKYTITGSGISSNSGNYTIKAVQADANATALTINPAQLTVTYTADAASRAYGAANGTLSGGYVASGLVGQDKLADIVSGTASWTSTADQTTGVGKYTITGGGLTASSNYTIKAVQADANATALTINPAQLTVTYTAKAGSRTYGDANGTFTGTYEASGAVNGDAIAGLVTGTASWASTADKTTGAGSYAITGSGISSNSANYTVKAVQADANAEALTITKRAITVTANDLNRIYGEANPDLTYKVTTGNLVNGDTLSGNLSTQATAASNVDGYVIDASTLEAGGNYDLTVKDGALTITKRAITVTADDLSRIYGEANPELTYTVGGLGLVNGDQISGALTTEAGVTSNVDTYVIDASALDAGGNYDLTVKDGTLTITKRAITVTADDLSRIYGDANPALTYTVGGLGLVNGDQISGALTTEAGVTSNIDTYVIDTAALDAGGNYDLSGVNGTLTVTRRALTVTYTADGVRIDLGEDLPALGGSVSSEGLVNGDELTGTASWSTTATGDSQMGSYAITGTGLAASDNYDLTEQQAEGNASAFTIVQPAAPIVNGPAPDVTAGTLYGSQGGSSAGMSGGLDAASPSGGVSELQSIEQFCEDGSC